MVYLHASESDHTHVWGMKWGMGEVTIAVIGQLFSVIKCYRVALKQNSSIHQRAIKHLKAQVCFEFSVMDFIIPEYPRILFQSKIH